MNKCNKLNTFINNLHSNLKKLIQRYVDKTIHCEKWTQVNQEYKNLPWKFVDDGGFYSLNKYAVCNCRFFINAALYHNHTTTSHDALWVYPAWCCEDIHNFKTLMIDAKSEPKGCTKIYLPLNY